MLNLTRPDHTPLPSPALPLVVAQARHAGVRGEVTADVVAAVQDRLRQVTGVDLERVAQLMSTDIIIGPGVSPPPQTSTPGVQLATADGTWQATVTREWVSLETQRFTSYDGAFRPLFEQLLLVVTELLSPVTTVRCGLRFVNVLTPPADARGGAPDAWGRWVRSSLVALAADEWLAAGIETFAGQMLLSVAPGVHSGVRSGPVQNDGTPAFLLDIDTYAEPQSVWRASEVLAQFDRLNESGVALFQELITPEMLNHLRGEESEVSSQSEGGSRS
ncbi:TIGR04255 family protein [Pedococcus bigeumensis]|uniref:TIGR04255 family protein n=1 Tax=Pedococcus bigeumensis TaxID=433644 RepID=UPI002FEC40A5